MARLLLAVVTLVLALALLWLRGMRDKGSAVVRWQRRLNRDHVNPRHRGTAGTVGASAALVRHTGRRSGRDYETPVGVVPTADGFVVGLVYGPGTDWAQNLLAGGPATVVHEGTEHAVVSAELCPVEQVADAFGLAERRLQRVFGIRDALRVRTATAPAGG